MYYIAINSAIMFKIIMFLLIPAAACYIWALVLEIKEYNIRRRY